MRTSFKWVLGAFVALVLVVALVGLALYTFNWNHLKPRITALVEETTGRSFVIDGDLRLAWQLAGPPQTGWRAYLPQPIITAEDLQLGNPEWAEHEHMLQVQRVHFGVELLPLLQRNVVIQNLTLEGATAALERLDANKNSWTFEADRPAKEENAATRWRLVLDDARITRGRLAYRDVPLELRLDAGIDSIPAETTPAGNSASPYETRIEFTGHYREADVKGTGKSGAFLSLRDRAVRYPLQLKLTAGEVALAAEGRIGNLYEALEVDLQVAVGGASMAMLYPVTGIVLPSTRPFSTDGRLLGQLLPDNAHWRYENFNGTVGDSDLHGTLEYRSGAERPQLSGKLTSDLLHFADLGPLIGAGPQPTDPAAPEADARRAAAQAKPRPGKVLPANAFLTDRWNKMDLDITFQGKRIVRPDALPLSAIRTHAVLKNGTLQLEPLEFGVAGGTLNANVQLNGRAEPMEVRLQAKVSDLKLPELFPTIKEMQMSAGRIDGAIALVSRGNSIAALLGESQGEVKVYLQTGRISRFLLEAASLNIASAVVAKLFGDEEVKINCAAAELAVRDGLATARNVRIGTTEALIDITGAIDLQDERLALDVKPESYDLRVISLRTPLYVEGSFADPKIGLEKGPLLLRAGAVAVIGAIAPAALALLPITVPGTSEGVDCSKLLESARQPPKFEPDTTAPIESPSVLRTSAENDSAPPRDEIPAAWQGTATIGDDPSRPPPAVNEFGVSEAVTDDANENDVRATTNARPGNERSRGTDAQRPNPGNRNRSQPPTSTETQAAPASSLRLRGAPAR